MSQPDFVNSLLGSFVPALDAAIKAAGIHNAYLLVSVVLPDASDDPRSDTVIHGANMPAEEAMDLLRHLASEFTKKEKAEHVAQGGKLS